MLKANKYFVLTANQAWKEMPGEMDRILRENRGEMP